MAEAAPAEIDPRADGSLALLQLVMAADPRAFAIAEQAESGSKLPLLLGLAAGEALPEGARQMLADHYPELRKWQQRGMLDYLFSADRSGSSRWFETLKALPRDEDDAFLLKLVILSPDARTIVPFMMSLGYTPAAKADRPLTLAVMRGKTEIFATLANNGADIFANNAEAFRLARLRGDVAALAALQELGESLTSRFMRKFVAQFASAGVTLENLRAPRDDDNGDCGLITAAKAGVLEGLAKVGRLKGLTAEDFLQPNAQGATLLAILLAQGKEHVLFDPDIWGKDSAGPQRLWAALPEEAQALCRKAFYETQQDLIAAQNRAKLGKDAKSFKLK